MRRTTQELKMIADNSELDPFRAFEPEYHCRMIRAGDSYNIMDYEDNYLKNVKNVICGGDVLNEALRDRVDKYLKEYGSEAKIRVGYGLTECTGASCLTPKYYYKEGGIGIPFPDMFYKIFNIAVCIFIVITMWLIEDAIYSKIKSRR